MILTLTPNPSLDLLFTAERLEWDDANRIEAPRRRPGGQGVNLARAARALGGDAVVVAPLGGAVGRELAGALEREGTPLRAVWIEGETRVFVGVRETGSGRDLLLNPRGPLLSVDEGAAVLESVRGAIREMRPRWVACCGSLARGLDEDFYAHIGRIARDSGAGFVPDCDVPPLRHAAEAGCDLLVPNAHEAGRLLGRPVTDVTAAVAAAPALLDFGPIFAVITLGADGAVGATREGVWHATGPRIARGSAVGAGDALLAGLLLAMERGAEPAEALRSGVAAGSAVLNSRDDALVRARDVETAERDVAVTRVA